MFVVICLLLCFAMSDTEFVVNNMAYTNDNLHNTNANEHVGCHAHFFLEKSTFLRCQRFFLFRLVQTRMLTSLMQMLSSVMIFLVRRSVFTGDTLALWLCDIKQVPMYHR